MKNNLSALFLDFYELTMAQGYFYEGIHECPAVFDYFFRRNPFGGGYTVFAGLEETVETILNFRFSSKDISFLRKQGFEKSFLDYLASFSFKGNVSACREGEIVFPGEPLVVVEAGVLEAQLLETALLNQLNFQSLIATKTSRIVSASAGRPVMDFGLRRAQGLSGLQASRATYIGGAVATSNVLAGQKFSIPVSGTMAHSWVQMFDSEFDSFVVYGRRYPESAIFLIDTYDTLRSGLPNAIRAARTLAKEEIKVKALRLDSGDLAYLSRQVRAQLDAEGFPEIKIVASGNLDEYVLESLIDKQDSRLDSFGVGTKMVTGYDQPALDGVYKLASANGHPRIKLSDNIEKINNPGTKKLRRYFDANDRFLVDVVCLKDETRLLKAFHPDIEYQNTSIGGERFEELLRPVINKGKLVHALPTLEQIRDFSARRLEQLPGEHRRFANPHIYRVGLSKKLFGLKRRLIKERQNESLT